MISVRVPVMLFWILISLVWLIHAEVVEDIVNNNSPVVVFATEAVASELPETDCLSGSSKDGSEHIRALVHQYVRRAMAEPGADTRGLRGSSYFEWNDGAPGDVLEDGDDEDPDFWEIVNWIGTQLGRAFRTIFEVLVRLCKAIYAGIQRGWSTVDSPQ
eukprot:Protomagalhaensia_sp_Gyna_25__3629@NODE_325_length_3872_cov_307_778502_g255_i0_p2_GENE_NODE_325_length_3872_cov_307_778502_g255_i0NODE_325_length_3872_cov_307_778502_g255_i0_p2_ORF_typecomplete_len159_score19_47_NODE_325_length_3872_cov_307_778502_g255_i024932969